MSFRQFACRLTSGAAMLFVPLSSQAGGDSDKQENRIEFALQPKNSKGQVVCALFDERGWLKTPVKPAWARIRANTAVCVFTDVKPGVYGISAYHDENKNGKLDTNVVGMPIEDYCASRDARGTFSAPKFEDAKFNYTGGRLRMSATLK